MTFSQPFSFPGVVEGEGGLGDGSDAVGTEGDVLERSPPLFEFAGGAFAERADAAQEPVVGAGIRGQRGSDLVW